MFSNQRVILLATMLLAAIVCAGPAYAAAPDSDGFVALFNGKDLTGWQTSGNWVVEEGGLLTLKPRRGERGWNRFRSYLWSTKRYADFVLDLEYRLSRGGNSGVFLRVTSPRSYIEVQIRDSYGKKEPLGEKDCGGVVDIIGPSKNMSKPAGQWNRMIITCKASQMQVDLNGEQIIDLNLARSSRTRRTRSGQIGLQDYAHPISFRNIRIKELE